MRLLTILLLLLLLAACQKQTTPPEEPTLKYCAGFPLSGGSIDAQEEYAILEAIMEAHHARGEFLQIHQETQTNFSSESIRSILHNKGITFDSATVEAYALKNKPPSLWKDQFNPLTELISKGEVSCLFSDNDYGWESYYAKYEQSQGYLQFARPAIHGGNEAILEYGIYCGGTCCANYIVILEKVNGEWMVQHRIITSVC